MGVSVLNPLIHLSPFLETFVVNPQTRSIRVNGFVIVVPDRASLLHRSLLCGYSLVKPANICQRLRDVCSRCGHYNGAGIVHNPRPRLECRGQQTTLLDTEPCSSLVHTEIWK